MISNKIIRIIRIYTLGLIMVVLSASLFGCQRNIAEESIIPYSSTELSGNININRLLAENGITRVFTFDDYSLESPFYLYLDYDRTEISDYEFYTYIGSYNLYSLFYYGEYPLLYTFSGSDDEKRATLDKLIKIRSDSKNCRVKRELELAINWLRMDLSGEKLEYIEDDEGIYWKLEYDNYGRLIKCSDRYGWELDFEWDKDGKIDTFRCANSNNNDMHEYKYIYENDMIQKVEINLSDHSQVDIEYNKNGEIYLIHEYGKYSNTQDEYNDFYKFAYSEEKPDELKSIEYSDDGKEWGEWYKCYTGGNRDLTALDGCDEDTESYTYELDGYGNPLRVFQHDGSDEDCLAVYAYDTRGNQVYLSGGWLGDYSGVAMKYYEDDKPVFKAGRSGIIRKTYIDGKIADTMFDNKGDHNVDECIEFQYDEKGNVSARNIIYNIAANETTTLRFHYIN